MQGLIRMRQSCIWVLFSKTLFPTIRIGYIILPQVVAPAFRVHFSALLRGRSIEQKSFGAICRRRYFAQRIAADATFCTKTA